MANSALPAVRHNIGLLKRCIAFFLPYKLRVIFGFLAMVLVGLCDAVVAWLVKPALDDIFINKQADALIYIPLAFLAVTVIKCSMRLSQNYLMQSSGLKVIEGLRDALYSKIILLPLRFYEGAQVGVLLSRITGDVMAIRSSVPSLIMLIRQIITMCALIVVVFVRDVELAFYAVVVLPVAFFPFVYYGRRFRRLSRESQVRQGDISSLLLEILSGIRVVKAFSTEAVERRRFDRENRRLLGLALKQVLTSESSTLAMEMVGALGIAAVIWIGGLQVLEGTSTPGTFFSFVAALVMLYDPVKRMTSSNNDIQKALAGADRVFEILDDPRLEVEKGGDQVFSGDFRDLRFDKVGFAYQNGATALAGISFQVKAGERIALVGPSGAGKTTFVNLIPRFYDPTEGVITLNGEPLAEYTLPSLRGAISLVSQESFLFNLSVAENIAYGLENVSRERIEQAARAAYAHEFIEAMPEGYDTVVGERGVKLSGGQKQRLTIARALVKNAPLLILDEATSALDSESESIVQQALENLMKDRTSIVIAHRLSTIISADRILVLDKGRLMAEGPHETLLRTSPLYARLYEMQFRTPERHNDAGDPIHILNAAGDGDL